VHGWDHTTIVDESNHYYVRLTGTGTADVTLRRLQNLKHDPGTVYDLKINGSSRGQITADRWGLVTIPQVADDASIDLTVVGTTQVQELRVSDKSDFRLVAWPNPFSTSINIQVLMRNDECGMMNANADIFNINGRQIARFGQFRIPHSAFDIRHTWDASSQPAGIYIIRVQSEGRTLQKRVTLVK
jgi:hypothetical protein